MTTRRKLQIDLSDPETRAVWECAKRAAAEVAAWPAWKHCEVPTADLDNPTARCYIAGMEDDVIECTFDVTWEHANTYGTSVRRCRIPGGWLYQVQNLCPVPEAPVGQFVDQGWHPPVFVQRR